ncbi:MAG: cytochrome c biogenesis protein CcdA [Holophaga sp.]|nr:cytochrome c biogenesis protein CcdA [Holophaga sp.]
MRRMTAGMIGWLVLVCGLFGASRFDPDRDVAVAFQGGAVVLTVPAGAHLKAAFMTVALKPGTPGTLKTGPLPATNAKDELGDGIWHGRVAIPVAGQGLPPAVDLVVTYQPCTEGEGGICYPPKDRTLHVDSADIPSGAAPAAAPVRRNLFWMFLGAFGFGLAACLTPCVYPMIAITMAIIGAKGGGRTRSLALSAALVAGMAVTYTALGVLAALTGAAFGAFAQSPGFLIPVSILFALFALSLLGGFEIRLPAALQSRMQGSGARRGLAGAFAMGLVLGPLSAPCVGPFIGTALVAIAQDGRVLLGAGLLFTFALGMGVLFMAVGVFSASLPRSGPWLERLKQIMGLVVLGFAIWNVRLVLPGWLDFALWSLVLLLAAPVLGAFRPAETLASGFGRGLGFLALALGLLLGLRAVETGLDLSLLPKGAGTQASTPGQAPLQGWLEQDLETALVQAKATGKPVLVDTYADWCAQCKELDENTWPDPQVAAWIRDNAVAVRIDTYKARKDLAPRLGILSYPTVILLDGDGKELRRLLGYQKPAEMLKFLKN